VRGLVGDVTVAVFRKDSEQFGAVFDRERKATRANRQLALPVRLAGSNFVANFGSCEGTNACLRRPLPGLSA